jgi:hypothetical protein
MSPNGRNPGTARDSLYTVLLAVAVVVMLISVVFVAYKCYAQYGTFFKIP